MGIEREFLIVFILFQQRRIECGIEDFLLLEELGMRLRPFVVAPGIGSESRRARVFPELDFFFGLVVVLGFTDIKERLVKEGFLPNHDIVAIANELFLFVAADKADCLFAIVMVRIDTGRRRGLCRGREFRRQIVCARSARMQVIFIVIKQSFLLSVWVQHYVVALVNGQLAVLCDSDLVDTRRSILVRTKKCDLTRGAHGRNPKDFGF